MSVLQLDLQGLIFCLSNPMPPAPHARGFLIPLPLAAGPQIRIGDSNYMSDSDARIWTKTSTGGFVSPLSRLIHPLHAPPGPPGGRDGGHTAGRDCPAAGQPAGHPLLPGYRPVRRRARILLAAAAAFIALRPPAAGLEPGCQLYQQQRGLVGHQPAARRPGAALPAPGHAVPQTAYPRRADRARRRRCEPAGQFLLGLGRARAGQRPAGGGHPGAAASSKTCAWALGMLVYTAVTLLVLGQIQKLAVPRWAAERQASAEKYGYLEERIAGPRRSAPRGPRPTPCTACTP